MPEPVVTIEEVGTETAVVRLNRPDKRNALSAELKRELTKAARDRKSVV